MTDKQIELIEDLPLSALDRWYTLLAVTGDKSASWLQIQSDIWRDGDTPDSIPEQRIARLTDTFELLGVPYDISYRTTTAGLWQPEDGEQRRERLCQLADVFVAHDQAALEEVVAAHTASDDKRLGLALGYPSTAVAVFRTDQTLPSDEWQQTINDEDLEAHIQFMLSKAHWQDEIEVVRHWLTVVREHSDLIAIELRRQLS